MSEHALLSASSSKQWLNCPPSAKLCSTQEDRASPYAKQGTNAHELCEYKILSSLGHKVTNPKENLEFYDEEMEYCCEEYRNYVLEQYSEVKATCKDPQILVEQRLDFSRWVPDGFGTGDCLIIADDVLHIIDFKYGLGVFVDANNNPQMMCYALGALDIYDGIYDIKTVKMTIFQPRRDNISTFTLDKATLLKWADTVLAPTAKLAYMGAGKFKAGDHCQFCKIKANCKERARKNMELAAYDFKPAATLDDMEISDILPKIDELIAWVNDVKEYALQQALSGTTYEGYKLVEGKSNRKYVNEQLVADIVEKNGFDPYEKKLIGITAMTSLLGKARFNELLGNYIEKPQGKPTLVPISDKRPTLNSAKDDFKEN